MDPKSIHRSGSRGLACIDPGSMQHRVAVKEGPAMMDCIQTNYFMDYIEK